MIHRSLAVCALLALASAARAELLCEQPVYDAGQVRSGAALVHRFTLVNTGKEHIEIGQPKPGCGCLKPILDRTSLAPGERATVAVEIHTITQSAGENVWSLMVPYSMSQPGEYVLRVKANLTRELSLEPASLILNTESMIASTVTLTDRRREPVQIRAATTSSPHVKALVSDPSKDGDQWRRKIALEVSGDCPEGTHEHVLVIHTEDAAYPELKLPFTVVKRSREVVRCSPASVEWRGKSGDALPARIVLIRSGNDEPVKIEKIEVDHPSLKGTFAAGPGNCATLRVLCDPKPAARLESTIRVHLCGPKRGVLTIPVSVAP